MLMHWTSVVFAKCEESSAKFDGTILYIYSQELASFYCLGMWIV